MSRFGKLEFESPEERHSHETLGSNSSHFLDEARRQFFHGDFEPALRSYSRALEYSPDSSEAWTGQVRALIELEEFPEANLWADKALERFPQNSELLAAKAVAVGRMGDMEAALALSDASMEAEGDLPYLWIARADVLLARKESTANYCFTRAQTIAPRDWSVCWLAGRALLYWNKLAMALKMSQQAIALDAAEIGGWLLAAECQLQLGLAGPAEVSARQAIALAPGNTLAADILYRTQHVGWGTRLAGWWCQAFRKGQR